MVGLKAFGEQACTRLVAVGMLAGLSCKCIGLLTLVILLLLLIGSLGGNDFE